MTLHFLNDVVNDSDSTQCKLISSLHVPGSDLRTHAESLGKPRDVNKRTQSLAW